MCSTAIRSEWDNLEEDILVIHLHTLNYVFEEIQIYPIADGENYE